MGGMWIALALLLATSFAASGLVALFLAASPRH
jgi:hypothetical protein